MNKLILFLSEACNLRCSYCYERHGSGWQRPGAKLRQMTPQTARAAIRGTHAKLGPCNYIQFFGGEPSLNAAAIRAVVDEVEHMLDEGAIARRPAYGIVSNGAAKEIAGLLPFAAEHNIAFTVSIDGPKSIHDALRPAARGGGSFDAAAATVRRVQEAGLPCAIETVYTAHHIAQGFTIVDLFEFCRSLGVEKNIFHTAYPPAPAHLVPFGKAHFAALKAWHVAAIDWWFDEILSETAGAAFDVYFKDLLRPVLDGAAAGAGGGCPGGTIDVSVGPRGDVYSCHLLYGDPRYCLGNVEDAALQAASGLPFDWRAIPACSNCFARHWCQPCGALNLAWGDAWRPPEKECELRRAVVARIGAWAFGALAVPENAITAVLRDAVGAPANEKRAQFG